MSLIVKNTKCLATDSSDDKITEISVRIDELEKSCSPRDILNLAHNKNESFSTRLDLGELSDRYALIATPGHESFCSVLRLVKFLENKFGFICKRFLTGSLLVQRKNGCIEAFSVTAFHRWDLCEEIFMKLYKKNAFQLPDPHYYDGKRYYVGFLDWMYLLECPTMALICASPNEFFSHDEINLTTVAIVSIM